MTQQWSLKVWPLMVLSVLHLVKRELQMSMYFVNVFGESDEQTIPSSSKRGDDALNNQTYVWYGNQWLPPAGVPMFTKEDMREAFSQFDTLWIGDSTTRRAYGTIFALVNSTNSSISVDDLNNQRVIDVNKFHFQGKIDEDSCTKQRAIAHDNLQPGMVNIWTNASLCRRVGERAFDYIRTECLKELSDIARHTWELKRYSLIIIGMGIHDAIKPHFCATPRPRPGAIKRHNTSSLPVNASKEQRLYHILNRQANIGWESALEMADTLEEVHKEDESPTAVLWRTSGFDSDGKKLTNDLVLYLNQLSVDFAENATFYNSSSKNSTLTLVDWGGAVYPRSLPPHKIRGDISAHYGLEARLLMAQMTTQQLLKILHSTKA